MEWHEVFRGVAEEEVPPEMIAEEEQARAGLFRRFRRNLGKARGAVKDQLKAAIYVGWTAPSRSSTSSRPAARPRRSRRASRSWTSSPT